MPEHPTTPVTLLREDFTAHETRVRALPEEKQRGDAFEQLVQRFLERDSSIRSGYGIAKTWLWADWPDRYRYYPQEPEGLGVDHVIANMLSLGLYLVPVRKPLFFEKVIDLNFNCSA